MVVVYLTYGMPVLLLLPPLARYSNTSMRTDAGKDSVSNEPGMQMTGAPPAASPWLLLRHPEERQNAESL